MSVPARAQTPGAAGAIVDYVGRLFAAPFPVRLWCWDSSEAGPEGAPLARLRSPDALRHLLWAPGELGVARAYVTGLLEVDDDLGQVLSLISSFARNAPWAGGRRAVRQAILSPGSMLSGLRLMKTLGALGPPPLTPSSEARPTGRLHSVRRDAAVISHHYDLSNDFFALLLDETMAYSCAYWTDTAPEYTLAAAQRDKLDLICRKLHLHPGSSLLDLGCGWGSLALHASREFGAQVTAITVSREQRAFVAARLEHAGVTRLVTLLHCDYRDALTAAGGRYDAVAAIEMSEHVGAANYPAFLAGARAALRDEGRFLLQVMSRTGRHPGGGPFIERYIAPDMHMRPLAATIGLLQAAGFEVRDVHALREHYVRTVRAWQHELERRWPEAVRLIGEERARVWRLYLAGGANAFEENRMGVDQILSVRPAPSGRSGLGATRAAWEPGRLRAVSDPLPA